MNTSDFHVTVFHPTSRQPHQFQVSGLHTPRDIVIQAEAEDFIPRGAPGGVDYEMALKGGTRLNMDQTLEAQNVGPGAELNIIPTAKAGRNSCPQ